MSEAIDRTPKLPKGSAATTAVTATAPEADAARTPAAMPHVMTAADGCAGHFARRRADGCAGGVRPGGRVCPKTR